MKKTARKKASVADAVAVSANDEASSKDAGPGDRLADRMRESAIGHWMDYAFTAMPTVNDNEWISLSALIAYVAHMTCENEFRVERQFADRFNIPNVKCLPAERYDDAVRYLVDRVPASAEMAN
ncbi:MAG: hypothetical protein PHY92_01440 [Alphaproteobacteria bacterium]|nr:hypothetical protein [Alphaproteobacteria bacterium]